MSTLTQEKRSALIDQLDRSYAVMPRWVKAATLHSMGAPTINPGTGQPFKDFREMLTVAADHTLTTLRDDFEDNGDLLPAISTQ